MHTLKISEDNPKNREEFNETIKDLVSQVPKRNAVFLAGNFNAKTGSGWNIFKENIGKYGKGLMNSSGRRLLELCKAQNLCIMNTLVSTQKMPQNDVDCSE